MNAPRIARLRIPTAAGDAAFMDRALALAARGVALASPNPMVGAVLVRDGKIIGEGFHTYDGVRARRDHCAGSGGQSSARRDALHQSGTLLPHGTHRAMHESADRRGRLRAWSRRWRTRILRLRDAASSNCARRASKSASACAKPKRAASTKPSHDGSSREQPLVTLKSALTLDGQLVLPRPRGRARVALKHRWISSAESRAEVQRMRHASDALLTGIGTVLADDPLLTDRTGLPRRRKLLARGDGFALASAAALETGALGRWRCRRFHASKGGFAESARPAPRGRRGRATSRGRGAKPDLRAVIAELGRREILSVLLEAGATLNSAALSAGIVDKMRVFFAPKVAGFTGAGHACQSNGFHAAQELHNVDDGAVWPRFRSRRIFARCLPDSLSTLAPSNRSSASDQGRAHSRERRPADRRPREIGKHRRQRLLPDRRGYFRRKLRRRSFRRDVAPHQPRRNEARHARKSRAPADGDEGTGRPFRAGPRGRRRPRRAPRIGRRELVVRRPRAPTNSRATSR